VVGAAEDVVDDFEDVVDVVDVVDDFVDEDVVVVVLGGETGVVVVVFTDEVGGVVVPEHPLRAEETTMSSYQNVFASPPYDSQPK